MSDWSKAYDKWSDKVKVDANFSWWVPWWVGALFTIGYADTQVSGLWEILVFFATWPIFLGEAMK